MDVTTEQHQSIARPPSRIVSVLDGVFKAFTGAFAGITVLSVVLVTGLIAWQAWPAIRALGPGFIVSQTWDAGKGQYGVLPEIVGTMYSSVLGIALGSLFGVVVCRPSWPACSRTLQWCYSPDASRRSAGEWPWHS